MKSFDFLRFLDILRVPVSLRINGDPKQSFLTSQLLSLAIIAFLIYNLVASDMIQKTNPILTYQNYETAERSQIFFGKNNITVAFGVVDGFNNSIYQPDPTIFTFVVNNTFVLNKRNESIYKRINKPIKKCEDSDFNAVPGITEKLNLDGASCIDGDWNFEIKGYFDEDIMNYLQIFLLKCTNSTSSNIKCKSDEEIRKWFDYKLFRVWIEQKSIDVTNYTDPIKNKIKTYFGGIEMGKMKVKRLFMRKATVNVDKGSFKAENQFTETYTHGKIEDDQNIESTRLFGFFLYASDETQNFGIRYEKIYDLLAKLGGITTTCIAISLFFVLVHHDYLLSKTLLNKNYIFEENHQRKFVELYKKNNLMTLKMTSEASPMNERTDNPPTMKQDTLLSIPEEVCQAESNKNIEPFQTKKIFNFSSEMAQTEKDQEQEIKPLKLVLSQVESKNLSEFKMEKTVDESIRKENIMNKESAKFNKEEHHLDENHLNDIGFMNFLKIKMKNALPYFHKSDPEAILSKCLLNSSNELDLLGIIKKLKDIEKLKMILLNRDQMNVVNLMDKQKIGNVRDCGFNYHSRFTLNINHLSQEEKKEVYDYLFSINEHSSVIDKRILMLVDKNN